MDVRAEFLSAVRAAGCLHHDDAVVLGVSGGADSLSLLHLFAHSPELGLRPHVLHLNHHIRGKTADADAKFVEKTCREWGIPCRIVKVDVPKLARENRQSIEDGARQARYHALASEAKRVGAAVIAVAHNADDQAETVLMHFLRGSGLTGLRGMRALMPLSELRFLDDPGDLELLRPLLSIPRAGTEAYCAENGLSPRLDETNLDMAYFRNRIRHEVMPLLEGFAPGLRGRLGQTASIVGADASQLAHDLDSMWDFLVIAETETRVMLDINAWRGLSVSLQRASLRRAIAHLRGDLAGIGFVHVEDTLRIAQEGSVGAAVHLPDGLNVQVGYDALIITRADDEPPMPDWPLLDADETLWLSLPGAVEMASGWRLSLTPYDGPRSGREWDGLLLDPRSAVVSLPSLDDLHLRARQTGDTFHPHGLPASKKLTDFMIDAKIPAQWRERIPLLVAGGQIVWVCGWRVDQRSIVTEETESAWLARFEKG